MTYAVIATGGKQYQVQVGDEILVEKLPAQTETAVTFDQVYLIATDKGIKLGTPTLKHAQVTATIVASERGPKIRAATYKAKSRYRRIKGHRKLLTRVKIESIVDRENKK